MPKGMDCPRCGYSMRAKSEKEETKGSWVVYECLNNSCKHEIKVFEDKKWINKRQIRTEALGQTAKPNRYRAGFGSLLSS